MARIKTQKPQSGKKAKKSRRVKIKDDPKAFRVVSYFAGCGGLDLGFMGGFSYRGVRLPNQPFRVVAAYDVDKQAVETYKDNIGPHAHEVNLATHDPENMPSADILIGGFPCQDFSRCGPRMGLDSERSQLYSAMVSYASLHKPALVVVENVPDLITINDGWDFRVIRSQFTRAGYRNYVWDIKAADYGIPQSRHRVVVIFVRNDIKGQPDFPKPTFVGRHRSIEWAIDDLRRGNGIGVLNQDQYFKANLAKNGHGQGDERGARTRPGYTVRANAKSRVQFHYALKRRLTVRECARLQTFPDWFRFLTAPTNSMRLIGNAVPPLLANKVASVVAGFLDSQDVLPREVAREKGERRRKRRA